MSETSRRKLLAVAGAGAAAGTVGLALPAAASARKSAKALNEPLVAVVDDPSSGTISLMFGDDEKVIKDRDLVVRLLNAAGGR